MAAFADFQATDFDRSIVGNRGGYALGFIRALAGLTVPNGTVLRIDPTRPDPEPELIFSGDHG